MIFKKKKLEFHYKSRTKIVPVEKDGKTIQESRHIRTHIDRQPHVLKGENLIIARDVESIQNTSEEKVSYFFSNIDSPYSLPLSEEKYTWLLKQKSVIEVLRFIVFELDSHIKEKSKFYNGQQRVNVYQKHRDKLNVSLEKHLLEVATATSTTTRPKQRVKI